MFASRVFMVSCPTFKSFIHFEFILEYGVSWGSIFIFLHVPVQFSQHHFLKRLSLSTACSCLLCRILIDHKGTDWFLGSLICSIDLYTCSSDSTRLFWLQWLYSLLISGIVPPTLFFFLKIAEAIQGLFWFHINFWNICFRSVKYAGI